MFKNIFISFGRKYSNSELPNLRCVQAITSRTVHRLPQLSCQNKGLVRVTTNPIPNSSAAADTLDIDWETEMKQIKYAEKSRSLVEAIAAKDLSDDAPQFIKPTFNLAAYVNKSETLQQFIKLGVDLNRIEKTAGWPEFLVKLDFKNDVQPYLLFLQDIGIESDKLGAVIGKNPLIFKETLDNLCTRINYLQSKQFKADGIARICEKNPFWLMFTTQRIDGRLGFFQKNFDLVGTEVRAVAVKQPKLITYNLEHIQQQSFAIKEEFGFSKDETKNLLMSVPKIWMMNVNTLTERFDYVHTTMGLSHERILQTPEVFYCREFRLRQRHGFLKSLGKAQYDPKKDLYVPLKKLCIGSDLEFAINVAKSTQYKFDEYLRGL